MRLIEFEKSKENPDHESSRAASEGGIYGVEFIKDDDGVSSAIGRATRSGTAAVSDENI